LDYDWVKEFLPRGGDAAATTTITTPESPFDLQEFGHDTIFLRGSHEESEPSGNLSSGGPEAHLESINHQSLEEQELDRANAHHLQRVESLLREDHVASSSPLEAVLENEVLVPSPIVEPSSTKPSSGAMNEEENVDSPFAPPSVPVGAPTTQSFPEKSSPVRSRSGQPIVFDAPPQQLDDITGRDECFGETRLAGQRNRERPRPAGSSAFKPPSDGPSFYGFQTQRHLQPQPHAFATPIVVRGSGRRKIRLRLQEEVRSSNSIKSSRRSLLGHLRSRSSQIMWGSRDFRDVVGDSNGEGGSKSQEGGDGGGGGGFNTSHPTTTAVDRGTISVSWFDGTSAVELQEHVRTSVIRKLRLEKGVDIEDMRILDDGSDPPEGKH
jgi:hypothetical protein